MDDLEAILAEHDNDLSSSNSSNKRESPSKQIAPTFSRVDYVKAIDDLDLDAILESADNALDRYVSHSLFLMHPYCAT